MSIYGYLVSPQHRQKIWLGKIVNRELPDIYFHIGDKNADPNSRNELLNQVIWKFLARNTDGEVKILSESEMTEAYYSFQDIGGDSLGDISYEDFLAGKGHPFEWLVQLDHQIQTPGFFEFQPWNGFMESLPDDYQMFLNMFGTAKMFRQSLYYELGVHAPVVEQVDGEKMVRIGHQDDATAYFFWDEMQDGIAEVVLFDGEDLDTTAMEFSDWLEHSAEMILEDYSTAAWQAILNGPEPFTLPELETLVARERIHCKFLRMEEGGSGVFGIKNTGKFTLAAYSIGVRDPGNRFESIFSLDISSIGPGKAGEVRYDLSNYLRLSPKLEFFGLPRPEPATRHFYREFSR